MGCSVWGVVCGDAVCGMQCVGCSVWDAVCGMQCVGCSMCGM